MIKPNPDNQLILDFLHYTSQPIFLTGKAGTGKTTLLRHIKSTINKNYAVVAPTAVAAINAGGVTLHSFFQIPFGPLIPGAEEFEVLKYSEEKTRLLKCLELLIIDEISMVRADLIDFIDQILRRVKGLNRPFGGVQLLMIGDLYQLSPIFHDAWHILKDYYKSPYFFDSQIFQKLNVLTFTLEKVYRQSDPIFLNILNKIRDNNPDEALFENLNARYDASLDKTWKDEYITLTTHNHLVTEINRECLEKLPGEIHLFDAKISGDFPKDAYPVDEVLQLKTGAQVMFIKNDSSGKKQFYNGKAGKIVGISNGTIKVRFLDDGSEIEVEREIWQNIKYKISTKENKINEENTGSFSQYPFKLAWAITIHKSQGLTFEKAIIDISSAFAHGHAYVALSRCRSLEGLILKAPVKAENIITDTRVVDFTLKAVKESPGLDQLDLYTKEYAWSLIHDLLDFTIVKKQWSVLKRTEFKDADENKTFFSLFNEANRTMEQELIAIAARFIKKELSTLSTIPNPTEQAVFMERLIKATDYFKPKIEVIIHEIEKISSLNFYRDENYDRVLDVLNDCRNYLAVKLALFKICDKPFSVSEYISTLHLVSNAADVKEKVLKKAVLPKEISNLQLYKNLLDWRMALGTLRNVPEHTILSEQALLLIAAKLPRTTEQLAAIKGVGIGNAVDIGNQITKLVNNYLGTSELF